jgi:hypothetical protein
MGTVAHPAWRKSSYSGTDGGNCVEAGERAGRILVRDTSDRAGVVLSVPPQAWRQFSTNLKCG